MKSRSVNHQRPSRGAIREVDLHLKEGYDRRDALERQRILIRSELDSAIRSGRKELVFIHGVGSGTLKEELIKIITAYYPACICHDASFGRYGYGGATHVIINIK